MTFRARAILAAGLAALMIAPVPSLGVGSDPAADGGLAGSGTARMQPVNLPARPALVAEVPGKGGAEAWALGQSYAPVPGWNTEVAGGQVLFLRYTPSTGWVVAGPPQDVTGKFVHRAITSMALAANGEGWAVGNGGAFLHRVPGGGWVVAPDDRAHTTENLQSVALGTDASGVYGYAVGESGTVLRLINGRWSMDQSPNDVLPDFVAVAALSREEAWAVGGVNEARTLDVYRRVGGTWQPVRTGKPMFDGPFPAPSEGAIVNNAAIGASIAAAGNDIWIGGRLQPIDPMTPFGDELIGVSSRPFVLRYRRVQQQFTSYCPRYHSFGDTGRSETVDVCNEPFPLSGFEITSLAAFPNNGGEAFAGGLGLFHFKKGRWFREPNTNGYLSSMSLATPTEGWVTTSGAAFGSGGAAQSTTLTMGHWTASPVKPRLARWPQYNRDPLEAVALAPDGSGSAIAVGQDGATVRYDPEAGWDLIRRVYLGNLHAVAWPEKNRGWAVGERGAIFEYDGAEFGAHPTAEQLTRASLYGIAFATPGEGFAVGSSGTILRFDGSTWVVDAQSQKVTKNTLYSLVYANGRYLAAGANGTVMENRGAGWFRIAQAAGASKGRDLFVAALTPDGTAVVGGSRGTLLVEGTTGFKTFRSVPDATIIALGAGRDRNGKLHLYASVTPERNKYNGDRLESASGWMMHGTDGGWDDIENAHYRTIYPSADSSAPQDPVYAIVVESGGLSGWAVGGTPALTPDEDLHIQSRPTSSVYRFDVVNDPAPPELPSLPDLPKNGFTFAVFGESSCGQGLCGLATGSGPRADRVPLYVQEEVNKLSFYPGGPAFTLYGGNMRRLPLPEELEQFRAYIDRYRNPFFAAIGTSDLLPGPEAQAGQEVQPSNAYYLATFADRPAPWGSSAAPVKIRPYAPPGSAEPRDDQARTHYAFDYIEGGKARARVIVLDSSTKSIQGAQNQNPAEDQSSWLSSALADARANGIPSFILTNVPTLDPSTPVPEFQWNAAEAATFHTLLTTSGATAVFTSSLRMIAKYSVPENAPATVPFYILGGGGAPLGATKVAEDGFYYAWHLVTVDHDSLDLLGRARTTVQTFPAIESIALRAVRGHTIEAGNILEFEGMGRTIDGGGPTDPDQAKSTYLRFGDLAPCGPGQFGEGSCAAANAIRPTYRFYSENPEIAQFVAIERGGSALPIKVNGEFVVDDQAGLLCTFKAGSTYINIVSGFRRARMKITVKGGFGPCVDKPVPPLPEKPPTVVQPDRREEPETVPPRRRTFRAAETSTVIFPPPPAPAVAPAPPAAPGVGRKEEHEFETEQQGSEFRALRHKTRFEENPWSALGSLALLSFMGAAVVASARQSRSSPARQRSGGSS